MVDPPGPHSPRPAADLVAERIAEKRLFEARFLLDRLADAIEPALVAGLRKQIETAITKAEELFARGTVAEKSGNLQQALKLYEQVETVAQDYPDLVEAVQRVELAGQLAQLSTASTGRPEPSPPHRPEPEEKRPSSASSVSPSPRGRSLLMPAFVLLLAVAVLLAGWLLYRSGKLPSLPLPDPGPVAPVESRETLSGRSNFPVPAKKTTPVVSVEADGSVHLESAEQTEVVERTAVPTDADPQPVREKIVPITADRIISLPVEQESVVQRDIPAPSQQVPPLSVQSTETDPQPEEATVDPEEPALLPAPADETGEEKVVQESLPEDVEMQPSAETVQAENGEVFPDGEQEDEPVVAGETVDNEGGEDLSVGQEDSGFESTPGQAEAAENKELKTYTVRSGDTLESIARKMYGDRYKWSEIALANEELLGNPPRTLSVGMELVVPPLTRKRGRELLNQDGTYTVRSGDSLGSIARKLYGKSRLWQDLYRQNRDRLPTPGSLTFGQVLRVDPTLLVEPENVSGGQPP